MGAQAGAGFRGAGPRSALGPLPNLSRRGGGGASWTALVPVLPEKFGWGVRQVRGACESMGRAGGGREGPRPAWLDVAARPAREVGRAREEVTRNLPSPLEDWPLG